MGHDQGKEAAHDLYRHVRPYIRSLIQIELTLNVESARIRLLEPSVSNAAKTSTPFVSNSMSSLSKTTHTGICNTLRLMSLPLPTEISLLVTLIPINPTYVPRNRENPPDIHSSIHLFLVTSPSTTKAG